LSKDQAINLVEKAREILNPKTIAKEDLVDVRCIALPPGKNLLIKRETSRTPQMRTIALFLTLKLDLRVPDIYTKMLHWVAMQFLDEPTFNQLRTIEQLGYVVVARKTDYRDVMGA
jgi:secreted Zn-dependent insulinase-like peptidase